MGFSFASVFDTVAVTSHTSFSIHSVQGADFDIPGSTEIIFPSSVTSSGNEQCFNITIEDDNALEGQHSTSLHLSPIFPANQIDLNLVYSSLLIEDNDGKEEC